MLWIQVDMQYMYIFFLLRRLWNIVDTLWLNIVGTFDMFPVQAASLLVTADPACEFSSHQWLVYLSKACALWEKDGRPALHFAQLCGLYKKALNSVPEPTRSSSSDCAQLCVDYIRLKAFHDPAQASVLFSSACETFKQFAFVHVAAAQFALSKGNRFTPCVCTHTACKVELFASFHQLAHVRLCGGDVSYPETRICICVNLITQCLKPAKVSKDFHSTFHPSVGCNFNL
uniref:Uncharacterized protein n=1 Tax=Eptatretus burgeri TaxID=7764 RepID=A0A8C4Q923_EPTBU